MFKLVIKDNICELEVKEFFENQNKIKDKYISALQELTEFEKLDKYLMQIIEEIWEVNNASGINKTEEICDIIMYLASTYCLINNDANIDKLIIYCSDNYNMTDVFNKIVNIRRLFPERKWHKKEKRSFVVENPIGITLTNDKTTKNEKNYENIKIASELIMSLIKELFGYIIYSSKREFYRYDHYLFYIETKENKLLN